MAPGKRLVIIDGYSLLFRAFFGTRFLSTTSGQPTNALYGFCQMLFTLLEKEKPDAIVVALDAPGKTFRHAEYAEYKGTRKETAPELIAQFPIARDLIAALGIPSVEITGYEADDIVGTISRLAESNDYHTTIVTGDLDSLQLVDEHVTVMTTRQGVTDVVYYTPEAVHERYGFGPELIPDYKAIVGDSSDNIPGVPGIGDKGATVLLTQFGSVENLAEHLAEVEPKYLKKLEPPEVREQMFKSKWLATIDRNVPVEYDFKPFALTEAQFEQLTAMLISLEFKSLAKRAVGVFAPYVDGGGALSASAEVTVESPSVEFEVVSWKDPVALASFVGEQKYALLFTTLAAQPSMFDEPEREALIAVGNKVAKCPETWALSLFAKNPSQAIGYDLKPIYKRIETTWDPPAFDAYLAGFVLQAGRSGYALRDLIHGYLEIQPPTQPEALAVALYHLEKPMRERLDQEEQTRVLDDIELPLMPVLAEMERYGIATNREFLEDFSKSLEVEIEQAAKRVFEQAGSEFNIGSPKQLGEILFEQLGIPGPKKTKTGYATGADILQSLAPNYPICTDILTWRELTKLKSTYADALPRMIGPDGRIHTTYNQSGAATGRLSSNDPNLQNIPIRTELGRKIRRAFVAAPGFELASFDYSQIELRLLAHMCGDEALTDAFDRGVDVHTVTASRMFKTSEADVTREQRRFAKVLNFAVLYGVSEFGLANQLGGAFSLAEARVMILDYFERFPKVKAFTDSIIEQTRATGFTKTLLGRRRYFPDIHNQNRTVRMGNERAAVNAPIQGSAADMIKLAMIDVRKRLGASATRMLLQVHDELVFELASGERSLVEPIREAMEQSMPLKVPVEVDAKIGDNWGEMEKL